MLNEKQAIQEIEKTCIFRFANRLPPCKPVKIIDENTIRKTFICSNKKYVDAVEDVVNSFIRHPSPMVVPVYSFECFKKEEYYCYSYDMMRLGVLSKEEREFIDLYWGINIGYYHNKDEKEFCMKSAISFPDLFKFLKTISDEKSYWDVHSGNILVDREYNYRIIDLEGFVNGRIHPMA